jgi:hypothetical protein
VGVTRELLELRDRALAMAGNTSKIGRVVAVDAALREVLRSQSLLVLEFNHEPLEDIRDLPPVELLRTASIFRDAIAVLDTIGWLPSNQTATMEVVLTAGHLAQLDRLRADLALSIRESLDSRESLTEPEDITRFDQAIAADRLTADRLLQILRASPPEPNAG